MFKSSATASVAYRVDPITARDEALSFSISELRDISLLSSKLEILPAQESILGTNGPGRFWLR